MMSGQFSAHNWTVQLQDMM